MWRPRLISIFYVALGVLALAALSSSAYGRAGGGGHFSGSGHSSGGGFHSGGGYSFGGGGSHGGSGGGSASPTSLVVVLAVISIVVIIIVIQNQQADRTVRRGRTAANTSLAARLAVQLKAADPAFEADRFYGRVSDALLKVQTAWSTQVLAPMQPFAADGVLERFGLQIREQQALDYRDRMEQVRVARVLLARIVQGDVFETATLRIDASAVDYEQSLSSGQRVGGVTTSQPFTEFWTFIRRRGAATLRGAGLIEGRCPNCGGDISINQNAACAHCGALLRSGQFDWVLCEITQESEWRPQQPQEVAGYDAMHRLDPGLSTDDLEDRASVIFWRRAEAERTDTPAALKKVALDTFTDGWLAQRKVARVNQTHRWFGEIGVGAVDTVELVPGADFDRAVIKITWTGTRFSQAPDQPARRGGETSVMREIFVLCRRNGVRSDPDRGISSAHCPSCGAPVSDGLADACHQCGTVLNDGSIGWVLERVGSGGGVFIASLISKTLPIPLEDAADVGARSPHPPSASGLVIWAISMGLADGNIDAREERRIRTFAQRARMGGNEVAALIAAAQAGRLDSPMPRPGEETKAWLAAMIDVALADGRLGNREATLLKSLAGKCGMSDADVRLMIKQRQAALRAAARHASRGD